MFAFEIKPEVSKPICLVTISSEWLATFRVSSFGNREDSEPLLYSFTFVSLQCSRGTLRRNWSNSTARGWPPLIPRSLVCIQGLGNWRVSKILHTHLFGSSLVHFSHRRFCSQLWEAGIPLVTLAANISSWQMGFFYLRNGISYERVNERKEGVLFGTDCLESPWHSSEVLRADVNKRLGYWVGNECEGPVLWCVTRWYLPWAMWGENWRWK